MRNRGEGGEGEVRRGRHMVRRGEAAHLATVLIELLLILLKLLESLDILLELTIEILELIQGALLCHKTLLHLPHGTRSQRRVRSRWGMAAARAEPVRAPVRTEGQDWK